MQRRCVHNNFFQSLFVMVKYRRRPRIGRVQFDQRLIPFRQAFEVRNLFVEPRGFIILPDPEQVIKHDPILSETVYRPILIVRNIRKLGEAKWEFDDPVDCWFPCFPPQLYPHFYIQVDGGIGVC